MSTYMPKAATVERTWYIIDAAEKPLGRVAAAAATLLRGKHKPTFAPHCDCGDHVIIVNCAKAVLTGKKLEKKVYRWHTGWIGHLKQAHEREPRKGNDSCGKRNAPQYDAGKKSSHQTSLLCGRGA